MKFTLSTVLFFAFVFDIQGFIWYKPQHPFDKVCIGHWHCFLGPKDPKFIMFRTVLILFGKTTFHMENMKDYGIKKIPEHVVILSISKSLFRWGHQGHLHPAYIQWDNTGKNIQQL